MSNDVCGRVKPENSMGSQLGDRGDNDKIIQNKISPNSFQF